MKTAADMIAETLGWDVSELRQCRYQRYTSPMVYAIGNRYFAASRGKPRHTDVSESPWCEHSDQFGARNSALKIWVCAAQ